MHFAYTTLHYTHTVSTNERHCFKFQTFEINEVKSNQSIHFPLIYNERRRCIAQTLNSKIMH